MLSAGSTTGCFPETAANLGAKGPQQDEQYREKRERFLWHQAQTATLYEDQSGLDVTEPEERMPLCMEEEPAHHSSVPREERSHWAAHCLCSRIWCQTTSAWKLYFSRLALTFIVHKKDYRPDSSSFHARAVPQKSMELDQHIPGTGLAQQLGSAGVSPRQLVGKKSSCREFRPREQEQHFWESVHRIFERERFSSVGSISPVWALHMDSLYRKKNQLAEHWFTLDPNIVSMQLPLHLGDVVVSSNGMFWKSLSVLLFMLTFWIIKLSTFKSALLWISIRIDQMTSRGP